MKVIVAENCGFCPGVRNAISTAEKILAATRLADKRRKHEVYSLGPIIHNKDVVERLAKAGLKTVNSVDEIPHLLGKSTNKHARKPPKGPSRCGTVIIRSHGAAPQQLAKLRKKKLNIVDATCVLVKRVQKIARQLDRDGYQVVVIGDKNHPEVQAVVGCGRGVVVVADEADLHKLPKNKKLGIVCQTTQSPEHFGKMVGAIAAPMYIGGELKVINTLCKEAIKRQESAVKLCEQVDIMFVLGGLQSANTCKLAELCKKVNNQTFHLQNWSELDKILFLGKNTASMCIGVTAGASTPEWIIAEFVENLKAFDAGSPRDSPGRDA